MNPFDEETGPQAFSQILDPQAAQVQQPDLGGMAAVLAGSDGPSVFERGKAWAQENPMPAQMLLHTFMRMAQGGGRNLADTLGQGVAAGAQAGLFHLAQGKQDEEKKAQIEREQKNKDSDRALRERGVQIQEQELGLRREEAPINRQYKQAMTRQLQVGTDIKQAQAPLELEAIKAKIAQVRQAIANDKDGQQTNQLRRQLIGLQITQQAFENDLNQKFAPAERDVRLRTAEFGAQQQNIATDQALMESEDLKSLTPEQRIGLKGKKGSGKTEQELYFDFVKSNADLFTDEQGRFDAAAAHQAWQELKDPQYKQKQAQDFEQALLKARNAVRVGEQYVRPDGKIAIRKN